MISPDQFAEQFKACFRSLWLTALGVVHDAAWAEDVVQEAAVVGLRKREQFQEETSFRAWMGQIVRFTALNRARQLGKPEHATADVGALEAGRPPEPRGSGKERQLTASGQLPALQEHFDDRLKMVLDGLDRVARACLLLRTVEGLGYEEISGILEIPKGTAMSHVHRSRQHLRAALAGTHSEGGAR